ncbi:MAG: FG-GAP-like repeat-containing protein [Patescibacteria group bacterium]
MKITSSGLVSKMSKLTVFFIITSFVVTPLVPVFAQEAEVIVSLSDQVESEPIFPGQVLGETIEAPVDEETSPTIEPPAEEVLPPEEEKPIEEKPIEEDPEMMALMAGGVGGPGSLTLSPDTRNNLSSEVDDLDGSLVYKYDIKVPPGRNDITTPKVSLVYNSKYANNDSVVGSGWSVNIPSIERINKTGITTLYSDNYFYSSIDGELVSLGSGNYAAKVEKGNFLKYNLTSSVWTVTDKQGTVYKFGTNAAERQDNPGDSSKVYKWMLQEVRDTNDNYIEYTYYKDAGQIYPSQITYSGNGSTAGVLEVNFDRTSRTALPAFYNTGFAVTTSYRITEIRTEVNNIWARKYTLGYAIPDNGVGSLLDTIVESGQDDSSTIVTLPAVDFDYQASTRSWTQNTSWGLPLSLVAGGSDTGTRMADINGDGLLDLLCHTNNTSDTICDKNKPRIFLNDGDGTWTDVSSTWLFPLIGGSGSDREYFLSTSTSGDRGLRAVDINGDGLADLVTGNGSDRYVYLNTGSGWTYNSSWGLPLPFSIGGDPGTRMADVNGDGLLDMLCHNNATSSEPYCGKTTPKIYLNNGDGTWTDVSSTWLFPVVNGTGTDREYFLDASEGADSGLRTFDINGDGLVDLVARRNTDSYAYINNGSGWTHYAWGLSLPTYIGGDPGTRVADINADGLADLLCHNNATSGDAYCDKNNPKIYLNKGDGTWMDLSSTWLFPLIGGSGSDREYFLSASQGSDSGLRIADFNGDGINDLVVRRDSDSYVYLNNTTVPSNLLNEINYSQGGNTTIIYKATPQFTSGASLLNPSLPLVTHLVQQIVTNDGSGTTGSLTYEYEGGLYKYTDYLNRKFVGFNSIKATDAEGNVRKVFYHQGNSTNTGLGEYSDHISKMGMPYRVEEYDDSSNLYRLTVDKIDKYNIGTDHDFVKVTRRTVLDYDGDSDHKDTSTEYGYDDANGNLLTVTEWGEVTGSTDGSYTDIGSDKKVTTLTYATNGTTLISVPYNETVTDQSSSKVKENKYYYDAQSYGSVTDGNQTKVEQWVASSTYINSQKTYNSTYGYIATETDPRGKVTTYTTYDGYNLYPVTITDPLSQTIQYTYDYSLGKPKQTTDQNGFVYQTVYDGLDRVAAVKIPDFGSPYSAVTKTTYAYTDTSGSVKVQKTENLDGSTAVDTYQYFDGLGRLIQERKEAESNYNVKDTIYNDVGLIEKQSLPYNSSGSSKTSATGTTALYVTNTYDPLKRISTIVDATGTTSYAYDQWKTTVTDKESNMKGYYKDAFGNLIKVDEVNGGSTYTTNYEYNLNNKLTKITDALSNLRNFTYDGLGRRLTAEDLHASGDGTYGTWTYAYDNAGNLTQTVSPRSLTTNYTYNDINQQLTEDYTGVGGTEITYTYGGCTNGVEKLCSVIMASGANTAYTYDSNGNVASEAKTINSVAYTTSYTYDRQGNKLVITYPDSAEVKYTFNSAGLLEKVERKESGGVFIDIVSNFDYSPTDKVTIQEDANGFVTTNTYDDTKLYRLTRRLTAIGGEEMMLGGGGEGESQSRMSLMEGEEETELQDKKGIPRVGSELEKERTLRSKTYVTGFSGGREIKQTQFSQNDIHYLDPATGTLKDINTSLVENLHGFTMNDAAYQARFKKDTKGEFFTFQNKRDHLGLSLPQNVKPVNGHIQKSKEGEESLMYKDALGAGIDVEFLLDQTEVRKDVVINSLEALGDISGKENYEIPFVFRSNAPVTLSIDGKIFPSGQSFITEKAVTLTDSIGIQTHIWGAVLREENGTRVTRIPIRYEQKGGVIYMTKLLPVSWLAQAEFPARTDAVLSYYSNSSGDGEIYHTHSVWNAIHDATSGSAESTPGTAYMYSEDAGASYWMARVALPFDTSSLPDTATITNTDLKLYIDTKVDEDNDGNDFIRVVQNTTASATALADGDFDQIGAIDNPTAGASDIDISGISTGAYRTFTLNSTGRGWINKTGYTKLGLREGHDAKDAAPDDGTFTGVRIKTANAAGTSQDPILEVTYTTNSAPSTPTSLLAEGINNPVSVADTAPEFSAIYNDTDTGDTATHYQIQVSTSSSFSSILWDSTKTALGASLAQGSRSPDITYGGTAFVLDGATYYWRIKFWDNSDSEGVWSTSTSSFTMNSSSPITVNFYSTAGGDGEIYHEDASSWNTVHDASTGSADAASGTSYTYVEHYTADYWMARTVLPFDTSSLPDGAVVSSATLYVYVDYKEDGDNDGSDFIRVVQNTTASSTGLINGDYDQVGSIDNPTAGATDTDITGISTGAYLVIPLNTTGKSWISKTGATKLGLREGHDATDNASSINTSLTGVRIKTANATGTSQDPYLAITYTSLPTSLSVVQDLNYTYDANGNILTIINDSETDSAKTVTYSYDDLNRLLSATATSVAGGQSTYTHTYVYDALGNITSGPIGSYTYAGTNYANPHAATSINGVTYTYDNSGNVTGNGSLANTWNYKDQLTQAVLGGVTSTYTYDHMGERATLANGTTTTAYPNDLYNTDGTKKTKSVYAGDNLVATIETVSSVVTPYYTHTDHLGSTTATSDGSGALVETLDYFPFGNQRISSGAHTEQRQYIGQEYDEETNLNYLNARYYNSQTGKFISQDPVFLGLGVDPRTQEALRDPQSLNSYSYARNNPITLSDPNGEWVHIAIGAGAGIVGQYGYDVYNNINNDGFSAGAFVSNLSSGKTYLTRGAQGAAIAATGGAVAAAGTSVGIGVVGQSVVMGGVTGAVGAGGNAFLGESVTPGSVAVDSVVGALTFGASSVIPKVPGRLPNFGTQAFVSGKHTQQSAMNLGVDAGGNYISAIMNDISKQIKDLQKQVSNLKQSNNNSSNKKKNK